jgi:hypothetical protein
LRDSGVALHSPPFDRRYAIATIHSFSFTEDDKTFLDALYAVTMDISFHEKRDVHYPSFAEFLKERDILCADKDIALLHHRLYKNLSSDPDTTVLSYLEYGDESDATLTAFLRFRHGIKAYAGNSPVLA